MHLIESMPICLAERCAVKRAGHRVSRKSTDAEPRLVALRARSSEECPRRPFDRAWAVVLIGNTTIYPKCQRFSVKRVTGAGFRLADSDRNAAIRFQLVNGARIWHRR